MSFRSLITQNNEQRFLLFLVLCLAVAVRLQYPHQTDYDSYWIHGMSESIDTYGYAKWVFHPASLFGYYPLSYPSGLMFLLDVISSLTGLSMDHTILTTGIFSGIFATLCTF